MMQNTMTNNPGTYLQITSPTTFVGPCVLLGLGVIVAGTSVSVTEVTGGNNLIPPGTATTAVGIIPNIVPTLGIQSKSGFTVTPTGGTLNVYYNQVP
jgi:hypothetical protein